MITWDGLFALKIDYDTWKATVVSKADHNLVRSWTIMDQLNKRDFVMYDPTAFVTGSLTGDEIVLSQKREFDINTLEWQNLVGNQLIGFRNLDLQNDAGIPLWQFCKIDLVTLTEETVDIPFALNNEFSMLEHFVSVRLYF
jgi:hypothetical protein